MKKYKKQPDFIAPELATLTEKYFSDKDWIYEEKFDGIRCIIVKKNKQVNLYSRNRNRLNNTYPKLLESIKKQGTNNFIVDGEIVAFEGGVTSFSRLQQAKREKIDVYFYVFDLLYYDNRDVRDLPLIERKKLLKKLFSFSSRFRYTPHIIKNGEAYLKKACKKGWEGIMAKNSRSYYRSKRTRDWLKFKCSNRQEFIIAGFTKPEGNRKGFGAILIGFYEKGSLKYAGKVGTGFDFAFLESFSKKLKNIKSEKSYFSNKKAIKNACFVKPRYVAEIAFTEWTKDNKLRHPRFIGLRFDKSPKKVVKERKK